MERSNQERHERRASPRSKRRFEVRLTVGGVKRTSVTTDVSDTGVFIVSGSLPKPGEQVDLEMRIPGGEIRRLTGRVARAQRGPTALASVFPTGFGVAFTSHGQGGGGGDAAAGAGTAPTGGSPQGAPPESAGGEGGSSESAPAIADSLPLDSATGASPTADSATDESAIADSAAADSAPADSMPPDSPPPDSPPADSMPAGSAPAELALPPGSFASAPSTFSDPTPVRPVPVFGDVPARNAEADSSSWRRAAADRLVRVLVIEETEEALAKVCALLPKLEAFKCEVERVSGTRAGLAALKEKRHEACLVWRKLGPEAGLTLVRTAIEQGCEIPMILFGWQRDRMLETIAIRAGAADVLFTSKLDAEMLERAIKTALDRARASSSASSSSPRLSALRMPPPELRELFDQAPCGFVTLDAGGRFTRINDTLLSWLGFAREELADKGLADLVAPSTAAAFQERYRGLFEQGALRNVELDLLRKDGTVLPVLVGASIVHAEAEPPRSRWCFLDITERRRAEAPMRRLMRSVEMTRIGVAIEDLSGKLLFVNRAAAHMNGYASEELVGANAQLLFPPNLRQPPVVDGHPPPTWKMECSGVRKDGTTYPVRHVCDVVTDARGRVVGYVTWSEDLSEAAPG